MKGIYEKFERKYLIKPDAVELSLEGINRSKVHISISNFEEYSDDDSNLRSQHYNKN